MKTTILLLLTVIVASPMAFAQQEATTNDGKKVTLNDDGTWKYVEETNTTETKKETNGGEATRGLFKDLEKKIEAAAKEEAEKEAEKSRLEEEAEKSRLEEEARVKIEQEEFLEEITQRMLEGEASTIKIGNLEVMTEDLGQMNWDEAKKACKNLGDGWRLPTKDELNLLYENKEKIGGFANNYGYWSSTESGVIAWLKLFDGGIRFQLNKVATGYVRAVRAFNP